VEAGATDEHRIGAGSECLDPELRRLCSQGAHPLPLLADREGLGVKVARLLQELL
jgi:hypothetical protein